MRILILDGHPDANRLVSHLLDHYTAALPAGTEVDRFAARDLTFALTLRQGYKCDQEWEPDLHRLGAALDACDHLVVGFPLWWGAEPALLKGLLDRLLLPGFAFRYHRNDPWWDRKLAGRSADMIVTMDTPPWYLRLAYGDPVGRRWRKQVLGFCGFAPIRIFRLGPTRRGGAATGIDLWRREVARAAATFGQLKRGMKQSVLAGRAAVAGALEERQS